MEGRLSSASSLELYTFDAVVRHRKFGRVAKWLCSGLQIRLRRFDSDLGLQTESPVDQ
ncbi:hypothetical protein EMIT0324P_20785 [Pseudomonas chlororaphis]